MTCLHWSKILSIEERTCGPSCLPCLHFYLHIFFFTILHSTFFLFTPYFTLVQNTRLRRRKGIYNLLSKAQSSSIFLAKSFEARRFYHSLPLEKDLSSDLNDAQGKQPLFIFISFLHQISIYNKHQINIR